MKIAFIGPGIIPIPPKDYGAIEILVWDLSQALRRLGVHVDIYNQPNLDDIAQKIENENYDFVHLQYDDHVVYFLNRWRSRNIKWGCTNHYGWFSQRHQWPTYYHQLFDALLQTPTMICLSEEIANHFKNNKKIDQNIFVLRNGVNFDAYSFKESGNSRAICVGVIDSRKNQQIINEYCSNVDFVGPIRDNGMFEFKNNNRYLGTWSKDTLYRELTNYSALILLSRGEAAPLVVLEAMAAGLSLIVSQESTANLDCKEYISVVNIHDEQFIKKYLNDQVNKIVNENKQYRSSVRQYVKDKFDWNIVAQDYLKIVNKI